MSSKNPSPARAVNKFRKFAREVIKHHFGTAATRIVHRSAGLSNFVFFVKHKEGDFIVRISPDPASVNAFLKEQWAQEAARKAGVPTAEILEVGSAIISLPYMITRSVTGEEATLHQKRPEIVREMGRLAARINTVRTRGFGATFDWSNNKLSRSETWKEYLQTEYGYEAKIQLLKKHRLISQQQARSLKRIMDEAARSKPRPVLNHGDIRLKNVIADKTGKISAIIDWEKCTSNIAPQWELSIALHDLNVDEMQLFLEGYGLTRKKLEAMAPLVRAFNVLNYIPEIERLAGENNRTAIEVIRIRLSGALDLYSL